MKLSELLAAFLKGVADLKAQANAVLTGLPPLEQHEATSEIGYGIRSLQRYANELVQTAANLESKVTGFVAEAEQAMTAEVQAKAEQVLLAAGEYLRKVDAEAARTIALAEQKTQLEAAFTAEQAKQKVVREKRAGLVSSKVVPLVVAEALSDEVLSDEKADDKIAALKDRMKKLTDLGLTAENAPKLFAEVAGIPLDADGDATFTHRFDTISESRGARVTGPVNPLAGAGAGAGAAGGDSLIF